MMKRKPLTPEQKEAKREHDKRYRIANPNKNKEWREANPSYFKDYYKNDRNNTKEKSRERAKEWAKNNPEKVKENSNKRTKESIADYNKKRYYSDTIKSKKATNNWRKNNPEKVKEYGKLYAKKRNSTNPIVKLTGRIRNIINQSLRNNNYTKKSKSYEILGCSYEEFKLHLESKWEAWMNWDNHGKYEKGKLNYGWDIDHIEPISSAKTEEDVIRLNHYTNLQPLCSKVNRDIKKNRTNFYQE